MVVSTVLQLVTFMLITLLLMVETKIMTIDNINMIIEIKDKISISEIKAEISINKIKVIIDQVTDMKKINTTTITKTITMANHLKDQTNLRLTNKSSQRELRKSFKLLEKVMKIYANGLKRKEANTTEANTSNTKMLDLSTGD